MKHLVRLILLAALLALGWWLWNVFFPSPAKVIRQHMSTLAQSATFATKDSPIARAAKAQRLIGLFSDDVSIRLNAGGYNAREISSHDELVETVTSVFGALPTLKVEFLDVTVTVAPDRQSAEASCTARVHYEDSKDYGVHEMRFQFKKIGDRWLITRAETLKTLT